MKDLQTMCELHNLSVYLSITAAKSLIGEERKVQILTILHSSEYEHRIWDKLLLPV